MRLDGDLPMTRATIVGVVGDGPVPIGARSGRSRWSSRCSAAPRTRCSSATLRDNPAAVRDAVRAVWQRLLPEVPFEAEFAEDTLARALRRATRRAGVAFGAFALLAILRRLPRPVRARRLHRRAADQEIGIRKVFGARTRRHRPAARLAVHQAGHLANLIAWPVAWWVMRDWLNGFDARIDLGPAPFVLAGLLALAIAIGTIAGHAFKVARANPILALRYE